MNVNPRVKRELQSRLYKDKEFLKSCNLMDYSLLMIFLEKPNIYDEDQLNISQTIRKQSFFIKREANGD